MVCLMRLIGILAMNVTTKLHGQHFSKNIKIHNMKLLMNVMNVTSELHENPFSSIIKSQYMRVLGILVMNVTS